MSKSILTLFLFLSFSSLAFSQNSQKILWDHDPLLLEIKELYLLQGLAQPFHSHPVTLAEAKAALSRIEESKLPVPGQALLHQAQSRLLDQIIYKENQVEVSQQLDLSFKVHEGSLAFNDRRPLIDYSLAMSVMDTLYASTNLGYRKDMLAALSKDAGVQTSLFTDLSELDFMFPYNAGLSFGGDIWNLQWARGALNWGPGRTGNLTISDAAFQHDYLKFTTFWEAFKFTSIVLSQDNYSLITYDHDANPLTREIAQPTSFGYFKTLENDDEDDPGFSTGKWITSHRLEARLPWEINIAVVETQIVESPVFDLRFLMPFMIYHNWFFSTNANNDMALELGWSGIPGLRMYGVFYADYISTDFKNTTYNDQNPPTYAYQAGFEHRLTLGQGFLDTNFEWVFLDPYTYINQHVNMTISRRLLTTFSGGGRYLIDAPLGYYLGPDTIVYDYQGGYSVPTFFSTNWGVSHIQKGENTIRTPHPLDKNSPYGEPLAQVSNKTPTGTPQYTTKVSLGGELYSEGFGLPSGLSLGGGLSWSLIINPDHLADTQKNQWNWFVELSWNLSRFFLQNNFEETQ